MKARDHRQGSQGHSPKLSLSQTTGEAARVTHQISSSRDHQEGRHGHAPKLILPRPPAGWPGSLTKIETTKLRNRKTAKLQKRQPLCLSGRAPALFPAAQAFEPRRAHFLSLFDQKSPSRPSRGSARASCPPLGRGCYTRAITGEGARSIYQN